MRLMQEVVNYQRSDKPSLPSPEKTLQVVEARISEREQQLVKIEASARAQLTERSTEAFGDLEGCVQELAEDDPNAAARPQLENINRSVADLRRINGSVSKALEETRGKISERKQQNIALSNNLKDLNQKLSEPNDNPGMAFLREASSRAGAYYAS